MKSKVLVFLAALSLFAGEKTDVLFYLQDAGETYALLPVAKKLEEQGVSTLILVAGAAEEIVPKENFPAEKIWTFSDLGIEERIDRAWERSQTLVQERIEQVLEALEPSEVVAGVAYQLQGQVLHAYRKKGTPTFAYWDNFQADGENPYFQTARKVAAAAEKVLVPCKGPFKQDGIVVGQPTLEAWVDQVQKADLAAIRRKLGAGAEQKLALFVGGYGKEYEEAFLLFSAGIEEGEILYLVQPHPKTGGAFERAHLKSGMRVLSGEISTIEAAAVSGLVICHQSTVAFQAMAAGKAVIHIIPEGQSFDSPLLQAGLAKKAAQAGELAPAVSQLFGKRIGGFYDVMGIPEESVETCAKILRRRLPMKNLSHEKTASSLDESMSLIREKVMKRGDLPHASVGRQLELLEQLAQFDLGRFLIQHQGGLNGFWTHYVIERPRPPATPLEDFLLNRSPVILATRERAQIFKKTIRSEMKEGESFASIPCGLMGDFLTLGKPSVRYVGIDLDSESIEGAKALAEEKGLASHCSFRQKDAWMMDEKEEFQLIASNGLNIYEKSDERVVQLYRKFHQALKKGGALVTSFLTPPPGSVHRCEWKMDQISLENSLIQKIITVDLLDARWLVFRSTETMRNHLNQAGFKNIQFLPDSQGMFITVLARKE